MDDGNGSAEITTPIGSVRFGGKRMAEIIAVMSLCLLGVLAFVLFEHMADTKASGKELTAAVREMASAQREMACIISLPEDRREREYASPNSFCRSMARMH